MVVSFKSLFQWSFLAALSWTLLHVNNSAAKAILGQNGTVSHLECIDTFDDYVANNWTYQDPYVVFGYAETPDELPESLQSLSGRGIFYVQLVPFTAPFMYKQLQDPNLSFPAYLYVRYYGHRGESTNTLNVVLGAKDPDYAGIGKIIANTTDFQWATALVELAPIIPNTVGLGIDNGWNTAYMAADRFILVSGTGLNFDRIEDVAALCGWDD